MLHGTCCRIIRIEVQVRRAWAATAILSREEGKTAYVRNAPLVGVQEGKCNAAVHCSWQHGQHQILESARLRNAAN